MESVEIDPPTAQPQRTPQRWHSRLKSVAWTVFNHARKHTGVGIVCSVAYFDPCVFVALKYKYTYNNPFFQRQLECRLAGRQSVWLQTPIYCPIIRLVRRVFASMCGVIN